jgi:hypothetical protein
LESGTKVIFEIRRRIADLVASSTECPELRRLGDVLAAEFAERKFSEGLEAQPDDVDIESSARQILKKQLLCLHDHRETFTPMERVYLQQLFDLVNRL